MMRLKLRVHPAGAAWLGACFLMAPSHAVLAAVAALAWHEAAHVAAMALCGVKRCVVELTPFGGMADAACFDRLSPGRKAAASLAGVLASALGAWLCLQFAPVAPFWHALYLANASLAAFNLLPVWPLDGARALLALAERLGVERPAQRVLTGLAYALGLSMVALGLYGAWLGHVNLSLLCAGPYLAYAAHAARAGCRAQARGGPRDARLRLRLRRFAVENGAGAAGGPLLRPSLSSAAGDGPRHRAHPREPDGGRNGAKAVPYAGEIPGQVSIPCTKSMDKAGNVWYNPK